MGGSGPLMAIRAGGVRHVRFGRWRRPARADCLVDSTRWSADGVPLGLSRLSLRSSARGGLLSCYSAADGSKAYQQRVPDAKGFTASPWANDGKIFCLDEGGQTFVLKAGPQFELLTENKLDEMCWATPAVADGALLLAAPITCGASSSDVPVDTRTQNSLLSG